MSGHWTNERYGDISPDETSKQHDIISEEFSNGCLIDEFRDYVDDHISCDLVSDFIYSEGDLSSDYRDIEFGFLNDMAEKYFQENIGESMCVGSQDFEWVEDVEQKVVMLIVIKGSPEDLRDLNESDATNKIMNAFNPKCCSVKILSNKSKEVSE